MLKYQAYKPGLAGAADGERITAARSMKGRGRDEFGREIGEHDYILASHGQGPQANRLVSGVFSGYGLTMNLALPRAGNWNGKASLLIFLDEGMRAFVADAERMSWSEVDVQDVYDTAAVMTPNSWLAALAPPPFTPEMLALAAKA